MTQPVYINEVTRFPNYPVNALEIDGVNLRSRKKLQGPTIIEVEDHLVEPKEEKPKPPFPERLQEQPKQQEAFQSDFDFMNELHNVNIKIPLL